MSEAQREKLEQILALHCAPTLAGLKAASMVSFPIPSDDDWKVFQEFIDLCEPCLSCKGIRIMELCRQKNHVLMLFYRPVILSRLLRRQTAQRLLTEFSYPVTDDLLLKLNFLKERICQCHGFPHEVGLFLGYPPPDVEAFITHKGHDFICCGYWKVYTNEAAARQIFACYNNCTESVCQRLKAGEDLQAVIRYAS